MHQVHCCTENYHTYEGKGRTTGAEVHRCKVNYHTCNEQGGLQVQQVHSCTENTIHVREREDFRCSRSTAAHEKLPYM